MKEAFASAEELIEIVKVLPEIKREGLHPGELESIGSFSAVSLIEAGEKRDAARKQHPYGIDLVKPRRLLEKREREGDKFP